MAIVTISRSFGSHGDELAHRLGAAVGFDVVTSETIQCSMAERFGQKSLTSGPLYADLLSAVVADMGAARNFVMVGRGGQFLLAGAPATLHLRVVSRREERIRNIAARENLNTQAAAALVRRQDAEQAEYYRSVYRRSAQRFSAYHLTMNVDALGLEPSFELALGAIRNTRLPEAGLLPAGYVERLRMRSSLSLAVMKRSRTQEDVSPPSSIHFAHPSEREFARLMDFYRIEWRYEPRTFPIEWGEDGLLREGFTPDFYLPEMDLYVELTTMKQSLVRRKNRKLRRLKELYPGVNIRVFYQKDIEDLVFKLGGERPAIQNMVQPAVQPTAQPAVQ
jgi:cytidylate kinase